MYRIGQSMENEWREHNRQRLIEERKVERGAFVLQGQGSEPSSSGQPDAAARLQKLKAVADQGLITAEEFAARKSEILATI